MAETEDAAQTATVRTLCAYRHTRNQYQGIAHGVPLYQPTCSSVPYAWYCAMIPGGSWDVEAGRRFESAGRAHGIGHEL
eukprot:406898-Rhodomonas_salina.2